MCTKSVEWTNLSAGTLAAAAVAVFVKSVCVCIFMCSCLCSAKFVVARQGSKINTSITIAITITISRRTIVASDDGDDGLNWNGKYLRSTMWLVERLKYLE